MPPRNMNVIGRVLLFIASVVLAPANALSADPYPSKPIKLITPFTPGGPSDVYARWLAARLTPVLHQPIVIENKAGAGGIIGTQAAVRSAPDGYTLVMVQQGTLALAPHLYANVGYDPLKDLAPIAQLSVVPLMLAVHPEVPVKTAAELIDLAKKSPGKLTFGSPGIGSPPHMAAELFRAMAHIDTPHIPYKGSPETQLDLVAGRLTYTIDALMVQLPAVRAGKVKALAVTSPQRLSLLPDTRTIAESGLPGYGFTSWLGVCAPAGTSQAIITRLSNEIGKILSTKEARDWLATQGAEPVIAAPEKFAAHIKQEHAQWGRVIREAGIKAE